MPCPPPGDLPSPGIKCLLPLLHWQEGSLPLAPPLGSPYSKANSLNMSVTDGGGPEKRRAWFLMAKKSQFTVSLKYLFLKRSLATNKLVLSSDEILSFLHGDVAIHELMNGDLPMQFPTCRKRVMMSHHNFFRNLHCYSREFLLKSSSGALYFVRS